MAWTERYVRADAAGGGDGTTDAASGANGAWTLPEAITNATAGQRINVRSGTYANTTAPRVFVNAGTAAGGLIWWRGFNSTPGDLDNDYTTAHPVWSFTTGLMTISGNLQLFTSIDVTSQNTSRAINLTATGTRLHRMRIENTNAAAGSNAITIVTGNGCGLFDCWIKATSTATRVVLMSAVSSLSGCVIVGGGSGVEISGGASHSIRNTIFNDVGGAGINYTTASTGVRDHISNCTFYSCGSDGIAFPSGTTIPDSISVTECLFESNNGYGINNATGTNTMSVFRQHNWFYNNTSGKESGLGDSPSIEEIVGTASAFTNAAGGDLSLNATTTALNNGSPGVFENQSYTSYLDIGAVQRQVAASGTTIIITPRRIQQRLQIQRRSAFVPLTHIISVSQPQRRQVSTRLFPVRGQRQIIQSTPSILIQPQKRIVQRSLINKPMTRFMPGVSVPMVVKQRQRFPVRGSTPFRANKTTVIATTVQNQNVVISVNRIVR